MKKASANKKKGWKSTIVKEFLNLTDAEETQIELKLLVLSKFPNAEVIKDTTNRFEFLLPVADENLSSNLTKIFNLGNCVET